jgi:hypothetical protein
VKDGGFKLPGWMSAFSGENNAFGGGNDKTLDTGAGGKDGLDEITGGGSKAINVTVHLGKFQDKTEIHVTHLKEGIDDLEEKLRGMFARVLNGGIFSATQ